MRNYQAFKVASTTAFKHFAILPLAACYLRRWRGPIRTRRAYKPRGADGGRDQFDTKSKR